jgi:hypothetical protein
MLFFWAQVWASKHVKIENMVAVFRITALDEEREVFIV